MTCDQAELRMAELLAGELAPEERAALDRHLLDCAACRADFELARAGARIEWADVSVPREVVASTLASFREPGPAVRLLRWATAAAAVFGVAALLLISSGTTSKPAERPLAAACSSDRPLALATMQDAVVGALVCKDEDGRPVGELGLKSHEVSVEILDGIAKTTVEENFENHTDRRLEGTFHFPLPSDASISRLALEVNGKIEEGTCLERERAREVFESIVRKMQDPALLEWQPGGFFKCRVFPIEPRSTKRVIVAYTQALPCFQGKMTYVYPLASEKTRTHPPGEASIAVQARFSGGLATIASPSHHLEVQRKDANEASMSFRAANYRPNNDFVVTMEPGEEEVRVVSHKTDGDDGYFACFATPRGGGERMPGRYAFVLDASASTSAPRLEVAKRLVRAMMEKKIEGDRFEILAHHVEVERSGEVDLRAANDFMDRLRPIGGSDVLKALLAAGDAQVIYIGKGSATFGETEPSKILEAVKGRRIRTIAVGSDANGTLLERLGGMMRVSPNDDVTKRVEEIAATLGSPVLSDVKVEGGEAVYDVVGVRDLFYGERLVVSGRYRGPTAKLVISGSGYRREVDVAFPPKEEGNNYVRRLWAQRKVSDLLAQGPAKKPEVTELGVKYQIMTPYTSFLVLETEQMWKDFQLKREVQKQDEVMGKGKPTERPDAKPAPKQRVGKSTGIPDEEVTIKKLEPTAKPAEGPAIRFPEAKEDPKARAIREAYEEQLRRDRQEVVLNQKDDTLQDIVQEFRRQRGWNFTVEGLSTNQLGGLEFASGQTRWASIPQVMDKSAIDTYSVQPFERWDEAQGLKSYWTKMDGAWDGYVALPTQGGGGPLTGATWTLETENSGKAARLQQLDGDMQVFLRQREVELATLQALSARVDESRAKLNKSIDATADELSFPDMQTWKELLAKRQPKGLSEMHEELNDEDKVIADKVRSIRVTVDLQNAPMTAIVDQLRETTGLKIHASGIDGPNCEAITFKVRDAVLGQALRQLLEPRNKTYRVQDGAVMIAPRDLLEIQSVGEDGATAIISGKGVQVGMVLAVTRDSRFVALLRVEEVRETGALARVLPDLAVGRVMPRDQWVRITDVRGYIAALPEMVRADLSSRANQQAIRAKMGLKP